MSMTLPIGDVKRASEAPVKPSKYKGVLVPARVVTRLRGDIIQIVFVVDSDSFGVVVLFT